MIIEILMSIVIMSIVDQYKIILLEPVTRICYTYIYNSLSVFAVKVILIIYLLVYYLPFGLYIGVLYKLCNTVIN